MSDDDPGVMGNLPRSRPGRRSSKRGGATDATASTAKPKPASGKSAAGRPTAKRATAKQSATAKRTTTAKGTAGPGARTRAKSQEPPAGPPRSERVTHGSTDPVTGAVLLAGKVVEGGLKVAGKVLKRLPRL